MTTKSFFARFAIISGLLLILLIPLMMVKGLVDERADRRSETVEEVSSKWGGNQVIAGPFLEIPAKIGSEYLLINPSELTINGDLTPEVRSRGIYDVPLYSSKLDINAKFAPRDVTSIETNSDRFNWERAQLTMIVPNLRGLQEQLVVKMGGKEYRMDKGSNSGVFDNALSTQIPIANLFTSGGNYDFNLDLNLRGSGRLGFLPLGDENTIKLSSEWSSPSFVGGYLPSNQLVQSDGFDADWKISALNTPYRSVYRYNSNQSQPFRYKSGDDDSYFGVDLYLENDVYRLADRSTKYAFFIMLLVFGTLFFVEQFTKKRINPVQYLLIGFALVMFYLLLLAFAEYIRFIYAYLIASVAVVSLLVWFTTSVLKSKSLGSVTGGVLVLCYAFNYYLMQSSDYTLLTGSISAFFVLTLAMYLSRYLIVDDNEKNKPSVA